MAYAEELAVNVAEDGTTTVIHSHLSEPIIVLPGSSYQVRFVVGGIEPVPDTQQASDE